ncbi:helix-turn-helix domain-containing protein [Thermosyntropha sp.]|uniref:helix-turn-helix domain-containing protein n=1 Tax=Thermosyntropha sp. TaxID=2740820 RepID=UPI0025FFFD2B|nr:helix-turn-helix domain-containing protein [Thermosyntropha sp.]MBO8158322.1 helix-turn-helix domain-containing protein [Thermosyntropha sp.]
MENSDKIGSFPPWSRIDDLAKMTEEVGIDFDQFIQCLKENKNTEEMAFKFKVSENTIDILKEHFYHYGVNSTMGGD